MSEHNSEVWADLERLSRRMARIEIALTERILALEAEVAALKGQPETQDTRAIYPDAREIDWCAPTAADSAIARIMEKG
jgi:hypothetical protein